MSLLYQSVVEPLAHSILLGCVRNSPLHSSWIPFRKFKLFAVVLTIIIATQLMDLSLELCRDQRLVPTTGNTRTPRPVPSPSLSSLLTYNARIAHDHATLQALLFFHTVCYQSVDVVAQADLETAVMKPYLNHQKVTHLRT